MITRAADHLSQLPLQDLREIHEEEFNEKIIRDKVTSSALFPCALFTLHSEMYELMVENTREIFHARGPARVLIHSTQQEHDPQTPHTSSLSASLALNSSQGYVCDISYFGEDDLELIKTHIIKQLIITSSYLPSGADINVTLAFHKHLISDKTIQAITELWRQIFHSSSQPAIMDQLIFDLKMQDRYKANI